MLISLYIFSSYFSPAKQSYSRDYIAEKFSNIYYLALSGKSLLTRGLGHLHLIVQLLICLDLSYFKILLFSFCSFCFSHLYFPFSALFGEGNGTPLQYCCLENPMDGGAWQAEVHGVAKSQTRLSDFTFTFHLHALEKEMATHSSVLAWRIPGTEKPGRLQSMGSHRVGHD